MINTFLTLLSLLLQPLFFLSPLTTFPPNQLPSPSKQICPDAQCSLLELDIPPPPQARVRGRNQIPDRMVLLTLPRCVEAQRLNKVS